MIANATAAGKDDTINNEDIGNANLYGVQKMTLRVCSYDYDSFDQRNTSYGEDGKVTNWTNVGENTRDHRMTGIRKYKNTITHTRETQHYMGEERKMLARLLKESNSSPAHCHQGCRP